MSEKETLSEFYEELSDIANEYFSLGEKLSDSVLVRKIVRSLSDRFQSKITAIEEVKNLDTLKVEELMGSLRTFELNQNIRHQEKPIDVNDKSIALKSSKEKMESSDEEDDDEMILLSKNFKKFMRKIGNKKNMFKSSKGNNFSKPFVSTNKKGIQCRECECFGHIQSECANTIKKNKKVLAATWSDNESESSDEEENYNLTLTSVFSCLPLFVHENENIVCLNNTISIDGGSHSDSFEFDLDEDSLKESYKIMYDQWLKVCLDNHLMANNNKVLKKRNEELDSFVK
ncbi:uncharacterized protein LOC133805313 isoform X2 [Humulus lupulus]|uniref:uncharacterized protein LOC133805313 isoform X2 n=1 Tax=Humulus lupulus TaxID=3486 RepID=UPI002B4083A2|nr:uncharacterized protein LOC133805313 isoform X2 [Humulus lupulus]